MTLDSTKEATDHLQDIISLMSKEGGKFEPFCGSKIRRIGYTTMVVTMKNGLSYSIVVGDVITK
jgi:hypothetical protein